MIDSSRARPSKAAAYGYMKILNHPDRAYGAITTRQMTDEEIKKYGEPVKVVGDKKKGHFNWVKKAGKKKIVNE